MYRDVALKSRQRISPQDSNEKRIVPLFVAAHDIDNDRIEELVVIGEFGDILIYKVRVGILWNVEYSSPFLLNISSS